MAAVEDITIRVNVALDEAQFSRLEQLLERLQPEENDPPRRLDALDRFISRVRETSESDGLEEIVGALGMEVRSK